MQVVSVAVGRKEGGDMNQTYSRAERAHVEMVKRLPCSVCDTPGPGHAHHMKQSDAYSCIALCPDCHTGRNGWHGLRAMWKVKRMDEVDALIITFRRLLNGES